MIMNDFILYDLVCNAQKGHAANRDGSFNLFIAMYSFRYTRSSLIFLFKSVVDFDA